MLNNLPQLIVAIDDADLAIRARAAEELSGLGANAGPAAAALVRATADADDEVREYAVAALENLGPPPLSLLGELIALLGHDATNVGYWGATLLGRLGSRAALATAPLAQLAGSQAESAVRQRAAWALGQIGPGAAAALPVLKTAAADADPRLAGLAAEAIRQISGQ